jgi:nicotinate-nucleotide--dimethylbenzimidazole phosphoribosyltransferase
LSETKSGASLVADPGFRCAQSGLLAELEPLPDRNMRLGEASGAATALFILRAALACHTGMATFGEAAVSDKPADEGVEPKAVG